MKKKKKKANWGNGKAEGHLSKKREKEEERWIYRPDRQLIQKSKSGPAWSLSKLILAVKV